MGGIFIEDADGNELQMPKWLSHRLSNSPKSVEATWEATYEESFYRTPINNSQFTENKSIDTINKVVKLYITKNKTNAFNNETQK